MDTTTDKARNRLIITTGNKGGVGKSTTAVLLADYLLRKGLGEDLVIGDSEMSDLQRTFYSIMTKSGLVDQGQTHVWTMATDENFELFLDDLNGMAGKTVIVDTGANMLNLLTGQAAFLAENLNDIHTDAKILFVVGPGRESTDALMAYIQEIARLDAPFKTHVIMMAGEEIDKADYDLMKNPGAADLRGVLDVLKIKSHYLGKIPERFFVEIMRGDRLPPSRLLEKWQGKMASKRFAAWLRDVVDPIFGQIAGVAA